MENFTVIPGDEHSTVILHVPHSSTFIPGDVRAGILLDDDELDDELSAITDANTDEVAHKAAAGARTRPWLFVNRVSRLVVDPERFPDETEEMNQVGMGVVYNRTTQGEPLRDLTHVEHNHLVDEYFTPYSTALAGLVSERLAAVGRVTIIDIHSYPVTRLPYELHGDGPRPPLCLGSDAHHTPDWLRAAAERCGVSVLGAAGVAWDTPFAGCYIPLDQYGPVDRHDDEQPAVTGVMLEYRRDLIAQNFGDAASIAAMLVDECDSPLHA